MKYNCELILCTCGIIVMDIVVIMQLCCIMSEYCSSGAVVMYSL